jgi:RHS repeat-associated protein
MTRRSWFVLFVGLLAAPPATSAQTATSTDAKIQAPSVAAPERGSLAGQLGRVYFGPGDVSRGAFTLPSPFEAPSARGGLLAPPFPVYSPDAGASEWGRGWTATLAITRTRAAGTIDYLTDDFVGRHGRLVQGDDGAFYPVGLSQRVRVQWAGDVVTAVLPDGTKETYGGTARVSGVAGQTSGTYAWHLTSVETPTGRRTRLDWQANATGRLFLATVSYGGVGDDFQYRITFEYEPLAVPVEDYRSGQLVALDQRVKAVIVAAKDATTGAFVERWRYELGYGADTVGPGFHLASVQRVYPAGAREPATTYAYHLASTRLTSAAIVPSPRGASLLATLGPDALSPTKSAFFDEDENGLTDLEYPNDFRLARQTEDGFAYEAIGPRPADVYLRCRAQPSSFNNPRRLAQILASDVSHVVDFEFNGVNTTVNVCNRLGQRLTYQGLTGNWTIGALTRLVDLDRDRKPDLLRVANGTYRVLPNQSTADVVSYGSARTGTLRLANGTTILPDTVWIHDFNGDTLPDIVARTSTGILVWFGRGNLEFGQTARSFKFKTLAGTIVTGFSDASLTFVDANKDGLADVVMTRGTSNVAALYLNSGVELVQLEVAGFRSIDMAATRPSLLDVQGSGNTELTYTKSGAAFAIALDGPETGLLASADDGKGNRLEISYGRGPATPGGGPRQAVLANLVVRTSGQDPITADYAYAGPVRHSVAKFLVGYGDVLRTDELGTSWGNFLNSDDWASVPQESATTDALVPGLERFESFEYADVPFRGVPWKRPVAEIRGFRTTAEPAASVAETTSFLAYWQDELCPSSVRRDGASGTLTTTTSYETVPASFGGALACLPRSIVEEGVHPDATPYFRHQTDIGRNAVGLVASVTSVAPEGSWRIQDVTYTPDWRIETIGAPGQGVTRVTWAPGTGLAKTITSPDGVVVDAVARNAVTDFITQLRTTRGTLVHDEHFRQDGEERLQDRWDSIGGGTAFNPDVRLTYSYATATTPAAIRASLLLDSEQLVVREDVELLTANGDPVGNATRVAEGWTLGPLTWRTPVSGWTQSLARGPLAATQDPAATEYAQLFAGAALVESAQRGPLGTTAQAQTRFHADVERKTTETLSLSPAGLVRTTRENGLFPATVETDPGGNVLARTDEAGTRWEFVRDALGRLREVRLPGGKGHRAAFDGHGRVRRVERDGIATVEYVYDATSGQLRQKRFLGASGALQRTVDVVRDGAGRVTSETHRDAVTGAVKTFRWYWDGATPEAPTATGRAGLLTAVTGDGYAKRFISFRADGKLVTSTVELPGFRKVTTTIGYNELGDPRTRTIEVFAGATPVASSTRTETYDEFGRVDGIAPFATFDFDVEGLLGSASFANGDRIDLARDGLTRAVVGSTQTTAAFVASTSTRMSARGLVEWERYRVGATSRLRSFGYTDQRFMETATDEGGSFAYAYDPSGLPTSIAEGSAATSIVRSGSTITAWNVVRSTDDLGRTIQRGDLTLAYGPDGQLQQAQRGTRTWTFVHDEGGHRLAKLEGGSVTAAYVEDAYLDGSQLIEPVRIGGRLAGVLRNGAFQTLAADARGTVMAEANGTPLLASPIGRRDVRPALSAAIDFVEKGYDADLGTVRMGVRDYDPDLYAFTTPDPLFLEDPALCTGRLVECSLYSYANNAPALYVDPSGKIVWFAVIGVAWAVYEVGSSIADVVSAVQTVRDPNATTREKAVSVGLAGVSVLGPGGGYSTAYRVGKGVLKEGFEQIGEAEARRRLRQWVLNEGVAGGKSGGGERRGNANYGPFDAAHFRDNLKARTGVDPGESMQAHHVFPQKFQEQFATEYGIDVHDPRFGAWWESKDHNKWATAVNDEWEQFLSRNPRREEVADFASNQAQRYGFDLTF